jgi:hypothetical protein
MSDKIGRVGDLQAQVGFPEGLGVPIIWSENRI